jgi:PAS domain S-box-containing protein
MIKITRQTDLLERLNQYISENAGISNIQELARSVEHVLDEIFELEFAVLYLYDYDEHRLRIRLAKGFNDLQREEADRTAMERHPGRVFRSKEVLNITDAGQQTPVAGTPTLIVRSQVYLPVMNGEEAVGALGILSSEKDRFSVEEISILTLICNLAGVIYGNLVLQAGLRNSSMIAEESDNAVIITDNKGMAEWVNRSFIRITGYTLEEVKGKRPCEILKGEATDPATVDQVSAAIRQQERLETNLCYYTKKGHPYWARLQIQPVFDNMGNLTNYIAIHRDITEQKQAQEVMDSITTRLGTLIRNMHSGILVEDQHRLIALVNQKFCDIFSIPVEPELLVGSDCTNSAEQTMNLFQDPEMFIKKIDQILLEKKSVIGEELYMTDGTVLERDYIPIMLHNKFLGNLWQYRDVTFRKQAEQRLRESEHRYRQIIDQANDLIYRITPDGYFTFINKVGERITGSARSEILGRHYLEFIRPDYRESVAIFYKNQLEERKENSYLEFPFINSNRKEIWIGQNVRLIVENDQIRELQAVARDITERKLAEDTVKRLQKFYEQLLDDLPGHIAVLDKDFNYLYVNSAAITNPEARTWVIGKNDRQYCERFGIDPEVGEKRLEILMQVSLSRKTITYEETIVQKNREKKFFQRSFSPVLSDAGAVIQFIGYGLDITDLILARKVAEDSTKAKNLFLATMSHEIRTPLNAIIGLSKLMLGTGLTEEQQGLNNKLIISGESLLEIINDILDFSKIEAGKIAIESIPFSLKELLKRIYSCHENAAEERLISLVVNAGDNIPGALVGDPLRLQQVLTNLVSNAIKFTREGGVELQCRVHTLSADKVNIHFSITDTGIGISKENLGTIFEKFRQEDNSVTRNYGGTGLGLAISQQLVNLMGGTIQVDSEKGKGSTFSFFLDFAITDEAVLKKDKQRVKIESGILKGKRLLIVEDNEFNQFIAQAIIEKWGARSDLAANGQEAVAQLWLVDYDLVLMDLQMPVMDGITAASVIRGELNKTVPIIALTANVTSEAIQRVYQSGMNDYVSKPFQEEELYVKVLKALKIEPHYLGDPK